MSALRHSKNSQTGKPRKISAVESGLSRREFLQQSGMTTLLAGFMLHKPALSATFKSDDTKNSVADDQFTEQQRKVLEAVQLQLFPADGDGPSAQDLNALSYLEWALTDPDNIEDGDRAFIIRGIGWLEELCMQEREQSFTVLTPEQQHELMQKLAASELGENWMSLLIYYLLESLLLDPVYGGNPAGIGWKWLEHQAGFPRPGSEQIYRRYLSYPD